MRQAVRAKLHTRHYRFLDLFTPTNYLSNKKIEFF